MLRVVLIISSIIAFAHLSKAQSNEGTEFWFGFMEHVDVNDNVKVAMITSKFNTAGKVRIPNRNWSVDFIVNKDDVVVITLPLFSENIGSEAFDNTGIQIVSNEPVSVYIHQYHEFRSEASVVLPVNSLGNKYFTMSYKGVFNQGKDHPSEFLIVGIADETAVKMILSDDAKGGAVKGSVINITLNRGETYQLQGKNAMSDLSGTFIEGDKNFAVFSGNSWTEVPSNCAFRDNLMEQMYALDKWGKNIVTVPSANASYDIFRIMSSEDNTKVEIQGTTNVSNVIINRGEFYELKVAEATLITADYPIQVGQFLIGSECSGHPIGDPSMVMLNSVTQTRDTVTLYNSSLQDIQENYINIIALTSDIPLISIDGSEVPSFAEINQVGSEGIYSYIRISVSPGAHTIVSEGCGVIATAYGYGPAESYAYSGGASFNSINTNPIPDGGCLNDTVFFNTELPVERYSFKWDLNDGEIRTAPSFEIFYDQLGSYPATLILTDECVGTIDTFTKDILITLRQAVASFGDTIICEEESFMLGATDVANASYLWTGPGGFYSEDQFPEVSNVSLGMAGIYEVIGIVSGCATFPSSAEIEVLSLPHPTFNRDSIYCNLREDVILNPGTFESYVWHDGSSEEIITVTEDGIYIVTVTNDLGCSSSTSISLSERCPTEIFIPTVFSPNDDGYNDNWYVLGHDIISYDIMVKNRWGEVVFESSDINMPWSGQYMGKVAVPDVYFYTLYIDGYTENGEQFTETRQGTVTLIR